MVEAPSYLGALQALRASEPSVEVSTDDCGLRTDVPEDLLVAGIATQAPLHCAQLPEPWGRSLGPERRRHLAAPDWFGFLTVEDDPYGVLRFRGEYVPSIRTFSDQVVTPGRGQQVARPWSPGRWLAVSEWLFASLVRPKQEPTCTRRRSPQRIGPTSWPTGSLSPPMGIGLRRSTASGATAAAWSPSRPTPSCPTVGCSSGVARAVRLLDTTERCPGRSAPVASVPGAAFMSVTEDESRYGCRLRSRRRSSPRRRPASPPRPMHPERRHHDPARRRTRRTLIRAETQSVAGREQRTDPTASGRTSSSAAPGAGITMPNAVPTPSSGSV